MQNIRRIQNRNGTVSWQIDFTDKSGKRHRKSYQTRTAAKNALAHFHFKIADQNFVDPNRYARFRLNDLVKKYTEVYASKELSFASKHFFLERILAYFDDGKWLLSSITYADLQKFQQHLIESNRHKHPRSEKPDRKLAPATINRHMATLRRLFNAAVTEWDMMRISPFSGKKSLMLKENNTKKRFLSADEIQRLLANSEPYLQDIIVGAINSGMRRTELLTLTWAQIKWDENRIELPKTKSGKAQDVILNQPLIELFKRIRQRPVVDSKYVFIWQDWEGNYKPVRCVKTAFRTACEKSGIVYGRDIKDGATFHTLRHTYGSHLVMRGASIYEVRDLMRHADVKTTTRYAHLSDEAKQAAAARLNGLTG
jgi:integrase